MSNAAAPAVTLDVPTGIVAWTGDTPGSPIRATPTGTLALPQTGLHVDAVGELWVADIGIPREVLRRAGVPLPPADLFARGYRVRLTPSQ